MGIFGDKYNVPMDKWHLEHDATDEQLSRWAGDPNCKQQARCGDILRQRLARREAKRVAQETINADKRTELAVNPFNPRTEISADAQHIAGRIVKTLWVIFVLLPMVIGVLYALLRAMG